MRTYVAKTPMAPVLGGVIAIFTGVLVAVFSNHRPGVASEAAQAKMAAWGQSVSSTPLHPKTAISAIDSRAEVKWILSTLHNLDPRLPWKDNRLEFGWRSPEDCYEAIRMNANGGQLHYYLRWIPKLTRAVVPGDGGDFLFLEDTMAPGPARTEVYQDIDWDRVKALSVPPASSVRSQD